MPDPQWIDPVLVEKAARSYHESARDVYMRVAGYGTIEPWGEVPPSAKEIERGHMRAALRGVFDELGLQEEHRKNWDGCIRHDGGLLGHPVPEYRLLSGWRPVEQGDTDGD